ncbi:hypothetical protein DER45DRAFT_623778 [Fusarium avenaceum]|nr:hypothetical protein DER45DRAFT_623778 [Fusarium avenaceum]
MISAYVSASHVSCTLVGLSSTPRVCGNAQAAAFINYRFLDPYPGLARWGSSLEPYHNFLNFNHRGQRLYYVHGVLSLPEAVNTKKMSFQGENEDESTRKKLLGLNKKPINNSEQKKKAQNKFKRITNAKKNELTGPYWKEKEKVEERVFQDKKNWASNGCHTLINQPLDAPLQTFDSATLADGEVLNYDCFMPTGQVYEFLPCAPWPADRLLGYQKYRGMHRIVGMEGAPNAVHENFMPYKLLLYRGWKNSYPEFDDKHRFVYLAENKPEEPAVGDCFVRLEEIHKRMNGNEYRDDCAGAILHRRVNYILDNGKTVKEWDEAYEERKRLQEQGLWLLRFRCWAVEGFPSEKHELDLWNRLFGNVFPANDPLDHLEVFTIWAELLRKSQGDKLGAKDFFGRYWDAVIPNEDRHVFETGFRIIVGAQYFQGRGLDYKILVDRDLVRQEVFNGVERAVNAPRLKFKPPLTKDNVVFQDEFDNDKIGLATGFDQVGWRYFDTHPGGLYTILVNLPVREFLCRDTHTKPFWQEGYGPPQQLHAQGLQVDLNKCGKTQLTRTLIYTDLLSSLIKKRNPTQDRCVADPAHSANLAMSKAYPNFYPNATVAKKRRVAEWLHRSAFSYGGFVNGIRNNSQNANNLVLGTPHTNTVMMRQAISRYEAFVKRLTTFSNNGQGTVIVDTGIKYPALDDPNGWMGNDQHQYTWLAENLNYRYFNNNNNIDAIINNNNIIDNNSNNINNNNPNVPHVDMHCNFQPLNRETCLLFQSILDKSLEEMCWKWECWDVNKAVEDALVESTGIDGNQQEVNEAELKRELAEELEERDEQQVQN